MNRILLDDRGGGLNNGGWGCGDGCGFGNSGNSGNGHDENGGGLWDKGDGLGSGWVAECGLGLIGDTDTHTMTTYQPMAGADNEFNQNQL